MYRENVKVINKRYNRNIYKHIKNVHTYKQIMNPTDNIVDMVYVFLSGIS